MKFVAVLLLAVAVASAAAKRDLLQAPSCSVNVNSRASSEAQDAISTAVTSAFASCKNAAGAAGFSCPGGCSSYAQAAGQVRDCWLVVAWQSERFCSTQLEIKFTLCTPCMQAVSQAFAKAASSVFASVSGGRKCGMPCLAHSTQLHTQSIGFQIPCPAATCFASGSARSSAQSVAQATAASFATSITQLCNGASAIQWQETVKSALAKVYTNAGVNVACQGGGSAQAAADSVAKVCGTGNLCLGMRAFRTCCMLYGHR